MSATRVPSVLFVGDDASSTQIAETLLRRLTGDYVEIHTAGAQLPDPGGRADQMLVMMGLDPAHEERLSVRSLHSSDRVVILSATLDVARVPGRSYEVWDVENDDLQARVRLLAIDLLGGADDTDQRAVPRLGRLVQRARAVVAPRVSQVLVGLVGVRNRGWRRRPDRRH